MEMVHCAACGEQISREAASCPKCGQPNASRPQTGPVRSKIAAGVLAILLGGIGIHKFYLGKVGIGIVYILFCWTFIPAIVALVEGIIYLTQDDKTFAEKQGVTVQ
jgi:TM2 domain-containing membrane protein YozV